MSHLTGRGIVLNVCRNAGYPICGITDRHLARWSRSGRMPILMSRGDRRLEGHACTYIARALAHIMTVNYLMQLVCWRMKHAGVH